MAHPGRDKAIEEMWQRVFVWGEDNYGKTDVVFHHIPMGRAVLIHQHYWLILLSLYLNLSPGMEVGISGVEDEQQEEKILVAEVWTGRAELSFASF